MTGEQTKPGASFVVDETRTRIHQDDLQMEVHQPHGELRASELNDGVELHSRVSKTARANTTIRLTWEQVESLRDSFTYILENND